MAFSGRTYTEGWDETKRERETERGREEGERTFGYLSAPNVASDAMLVRLYVPSS